MCVGGEGEINLPHPRGVNPLRRCEVEEPTDYTEKSVQQRAQVPTEGKSALVDIIHMPKTYSIKHTLPKDKGTQVQLAPSLGNTVRLQFSTNHKEALPMRHLLVWYPWATPL